MRGHHSRIVFILLKKNDDYLYTFNSNVSILYLRGWTLGEQNLHRIIKLQGLVLRFHPAPKPTHTRWSNHQSCLIRFSASQLTQHTVRYLEPFQNTEFSSEDNVAHAPKEAGGLSKAQPYPQQSPPLVKSAYSPAP